MATTTVSRGTGPMTLEDVQRVMQGVQEEAAEMRRRFAQEAKKMIDASIEEAASTIAAHRRTMAADVDPDVAGELERLRREIDAERKNGENLRAQYAETERATRTASMKARVHDALLKHGCKRPDMLAVVIQGSIELADDGQAVASYVDDYGCRVRASVERFVGERCVKDYPELFSAPGSSHRPAYKFAKKQFLDVEFYKKHRDAMDAALVAGEVEGLKVEPKRPPSPPIDRSKD